MRRSRRRRYLIIFESWDWTGFLRGRWLGENTFQVEFIEPLSRAYTVLWRFNFKRGKAEIHISNRFFMTLDPETEGLEGKIAAVK
jgi:hypothetical protein